MVKPPSEALRVVAFGGGTGLSGLLRGLASLGPRVETTAIVAVSDDGGSTGKLRAAYDIPAVGDARACLSAVAQREEWGRMLEYRFRRPGVLHGHALGNLLLAALHEQQGRLSKAIDHLSALIGTRARILPATDAAPRLVAQLVDGRIIEGEHVLSSVVGPIERLQLWPETVTPAPGVLDAIAKAQLIVLGPGSLFTSVIASALAAGVPQAIGRSRAKKVFVQNLTTQRGETDDMGVIDHVQAMRRHLGPHCIDAVLVHLWNGQPPSQGLVSDRRALAAIGVQELPARLATEGGRGRLHHPRRLAHALYEYGRTIIEPLPLRAADG